ncbi:MAG TPA: glycosyltransferase family 39 protein [Paucimonas sp.]|nr:glycosyltransferase family 39 protein [Paucimonas sp.]
MKGTMSAPRVASRYLLLGLLLITLFGAYLRVNAALHTTVLYPLRADAGQYFSYAFNLRHFGVYSHEPKFAAPADGIAPRPDALRPPGYPLLLTLFAGEVSAAKTILHITLLQAVLGILMIPLVYLIGRELLPDPWPLLPALLVAISPQLVISGTYVLSETWFAFLMLLSIAGMIAQFRKPERAGYAVLAGVLVGLAALTRPTLQYFVPMVLIGMLPLLPAGTRLRQAVAMSAGFAIAFAPWIARNLLTLGTSSDPTLMISSLVHGHYPGLMYEGRAESLGYPYRFDPRIGEISASVASVLGEIGRRFAAEPGTYLHWYLVGKPLSFLSWGDAAAAGDIFTYPTPQSPYHGAPFFQLTKAAMQSTHWLWVGLALAGTALVALPRIRRTLDGASRTALQLLVLIMAYFVAIHMVGFPIARYNIPLLPVIYLLSAYVIVHLASTYGHKHSMTAS